MSQSAPEKSAAPTVPAAKVGGIHVAWLLGDRPSTFKTADGQQRTVVDLRDPARVSRSIVIWMDGAPGPLDDVLPGSLIQLQLESIRGGKQRGELVGSVDRAVVEAAFAHAIPPRS